MPKLKENGVSAVQFFPHIRAPEQTHGLLGAKLGTFTRRVFAFLCLCSNNRLKNKDIYSYLLIYVIASLFFISLHAFISLSFILLSNVKVLALSSFLTFGLALSVERERRRGIIEEEDNFHFYFFMRPFPVFGCAIQGQEENEWEKGQGIL